MATYSPQKMPIQGISQFFVDTTPRVVTLEYRLLTITDPTGRQTQLGYDANGRIQTITDWTSRVWTYGYDASGNLVNVTSPATADFPAGTLERRRNGLDGRCRCGEDSGAEILEMLGENAGKYWDLPGDGRTQ